MPPHGIQKLGLGKTSGVRSGQKSVAKTLHEKVKLRSDLHVCFEICIDLHLLEETI